MEQRRERSRAGAFSPVFIFSGTKEGSEEGDSAQENIDNFNSRGKEAKRESKI